VLTAREAWSRQRNTVPDAEAPERNSPVVIFDGVCNLCNAAVRFIIARDPHTVFRFAARQSGAAGRLLELSRSGGGATPPDSVILIENARAYVQSTAALRIARRLRFPWPLVYGLIIVPRPLRDWAYDFIARRRYRWFGKRETCQLPTPDEQKRFLAE
jgi:predicted DCC family thiol-disulfide oxidoreductase YuxK